VEGRSVIAALLSVLALATIWAAAIVWLVRQ
jgi:hypothetical protein